MVAAMVAEANGKWRQKWWQMAGGGGNIGGYIGGKKHKPPIILFRWAAMGLTLNPRYTQYSMGLTISLSISFFLYIFLES